MPKGHRILDAACGLSGSVGRGVLVVLATERLVGLTLLLARLKVEVRHGLSLLRLILAVPLCDALLLSLLRFLEDLLEIVLLFLRISDDDRRVVFQVRLLLSVETYS